MVRMELKPNVWKSWEFLRIQMKIKSNWPTYLKMARKWHPDKNPNQSEEDAAQFKKILKAYETLVGKR
jgi:DnaJ-class molecular chaperone